MFNINLNNADIAEMPSKHPEQLPDILSQLFTKLGTTQVAKTIRIKIMTDVFKVAPTEH